MVRDEPFFKHKICQVLKRQLGGDTTSVKFARLIEPISDDLQFLWEIWLLINERWGLNPGCDALHWSLSFQITSFSKLFKYPQALIKRLDVIVSILHKILVALDVILSCRWFESSFWFDLDVLAFTPRSNTHLGVTSLWVCFETVVDWDVLHSWLPVGLHLHNFHFPLKFLLLYLVV